MREIDVHEKLKRMKRFGDLTGAEILLREWAAGSNNFADKWHAVSVLHIFAVSEGWLDKAHEYACELVDMDPEDPYAHNCLAMVYRLRRDYENAAIEYRKALELSKKEGDPNTFAYTTDLANLLLQMNALGECERLALTDLDNEEYYINKLILANRFHLLGRLYRKKGDYQASIDFLRKALRAIHSSDHLVFGSSLLDELAEIIYEAEESQR